MDTLLLTTLVLASVAAEEVATPSSLLGPRNFNHHPYEFQQYLKEVEPTKQGPVLFPNDGPPRPKPPLIVTSRPLLESIARSELVQNNSIASPSQISQYTYKPQYQLPDYKPVFIKPEFRLKPEYRKPVFGAPKPDFLGRIKNYKPYVFPVVTTPVPLDYGSYDGGVGSKLDVASVDNRYSDYEEQTLPPIYKAISDHARQKVIQLKRKPVIKQEYQVKEHIPDHTRDTNNHDQDDNSENNQGSNYAFSYTVRDKKTGDDFSHSQHSSGSATNGEYRVRLPDGRMQIVSYTADENGYKADVRYDDLHTNNIDHNNDYKSDYGNDYKNSNHGSKSDYGSNDAGYRKDYDYNGVRNNYVHDSDRNYAEEPKSYQNQKVHNDYSHSANDYRDDTHDYVQNREYKPEYNDNYKSNKDDYNQYSDLSKEYYNGDYSLEYDGKNDNYEPHRSKFALYNPQNQHLGTIVVPTLKPNLVSASTVKPPYEELKDLFVTKKVYNVTPTPKFSPVVEINVPSTTGNPNSDNTEHVVLIGHNKPNLYTNIGNIPLTVTPLPVRPSSFASPKSYLVSSISNLKDRINAKPVLSDSFIKRINKYLNFN